MNGANTDTSQANEQRESITWHIDDVDWIPLTGLFIQKAGYKTVVPPEFTSNAYSIELTTVGPGGSSPTHVEPWAHVFYVLSGQGEVTVEDEITELHAGSVSPIAAGQPHSFRNLGDTSLQMLVIYHPPRKRNAAKTFDPLEVRVERVTREAASVLSLELASIDGAPLPPYEPGSHIDLHLPNDTVRSYSLCGDKLGRYRIAIHKDPVSRGGSQFVHDVLRVGTTLSVSQPRNNFTLHEGASHSVFIAGGIGITPILSMLRRMHQLGRSTELIYAARSRAEAAFVSEIEALGVPVLWHFNDEQGCSPDLASLLQGRAPEAHYYACGPSAMLDSFEATCVEYKLPNAHIERFSAKSNAPTLQSDYTVRLAKSGRKLDVRGDQSLLDALTGSGLYVPFSCREGICGTCKIPVIAGKPRHRDSVLNAEERASGRVMMPCISGCEGNELVLDL